MKSLTIGRLAKQAGVNLETVRFYERRGLLLKPPRAASGYRLFPADAARRLRFIRRAPELGFSLTEIGELLSLRVSRRTTGVDIRTRAEAKIADIEAKIRSLESMKKTLRKLTRVTKRLGERLNELKEAHNKVITLADNLSPFYVPEIHEMTERCLKESGLEIIEIQAPSEEFFTSGWYEQGKKRQDAFFAGYTEVARLIRERIASLGILPQ